jgi:hypothetical protein
MKKDKRDCRWLVTGEAFEWTDGHVFESRSEAEEYFRERIHAGCLSEELVLYRLTDPIMARMVLEWDD